jgi:6-phosphogluconolactonase
MANRTRPTSVYVGTYAGKEEEGIHVFTFDEDSGRLERIHGISGIENPSFLTVDPEKNMLYAVSETEKYQGKPGGGVFSYAIETESGRLSYRNERFSFGGAPCYVSQDQTRRYLFAANYLGANAAVWGIGPDGSLKESTAQVRHTGSGPRADRQEAPHPHSIVADPGNRYVLVPDLGLDRVVIYKLDASTGALTPHGEAKLSPGSGPRHLAFHPRGDLLYVINELNCTITTFAYDGLHGTCRELQSVSTLPEHHDGENTCADIHVDQSGTFVYGSNRGHDSIAVFRIDAAEGTLTLVDHTPTRGRTPRNFALSPDGKFLLAANQDTDSIVTFAIDQATGRLTPTGDIVSVRKPVCIRFYQPYSG